jgi:hypothetical protein
MPSCPRSEIVAKGEIGVYHCWNRCVQRAWLCGRDPVTGVDYEYRRFAIVEVEQALARLFAIDIGSHAELANHMHLVVRTRPDIAETYSDLEIVRRWWYICRLKRAANSDITDINAPTPEQLQHVCQCPERVEELRRRLSDVSWFMGTLCEHLARRFNHESGTSGAFWEHRFGCRSLADESAIVLCSIYVDLNPIRAGEVQVPEEACHTSAYDRIQGRLLRAQDQRGELNSCPLPSRRMYPDDWLCPLTVDEHDASQLGAVGSQLPWRASDKGLLPMSLEKYLDLLDWTGRHMRSDGEAGAVPESLAPILDRLGIRPEYWLQSVCEFDRRFGRVVGSVATVLQAARRAGRRWLYGKSQCALAFA